MLINKERVSENTEAQCSWGRPLQEKEKHQLEIFHLSCNSAEVITDPIISPTSCL